MKNWVLLTLVVLLGLPGCCCRKKDKCEPRKSKCVEKCVDLPESSDLSTSMDMKVGEWREVDENMGDEYPSEEGGWMDEEYPEGGRWKDEKHPKGGTWRDEHYRMHEDMMDEDEDEDEDEEMYEEDVEWYPATEDDLHGMSVAQDNKKEDKQEFAWVDAQEESKVVYFDLGKADIRNDRESDMVADVQQLKEMLAQADKSGLDATLVVEGHSCHSCGTAAYNLALSETRASQVADKVAAMGISKDRIKVVGRGQEMLALVNGKQCTGSREEQAPNRRVEMRVAFS